MMKMVMAMAAIAVAGSVECATSSLKTPLGMLEFEVKEHFRDSESHPVADLNLGIAGTWTRQDKSKVTTLEENGESFIQAEGDPEGKRRLGFWTKDIISVKAEDQLDIELNLRDGTKPGDLEKDPTYVVYVKVFDAKGKDVTDELALCAASWTYSPYSHTFYRMSLRLERDWKIAKYSFVVPKGVSGVKIGVCTWEAMCLQCKTIKVAARSGGERTLKNGESDLKLTVATTAEKAGVISVKATVEDVAREPHPRALQLVMKYAANLKGWRYHGDWRTDEEIKADSVFGSFDLIIGHKISQLAITAVSKDGRGIAVGTGLQDCEHEGRVVKADGIYSTIPVGLLKRGDDGHGTKATVEWLVFPFKGDWGFRSAAKVYYEHQAEFVKSPFNPLTDEGTVLWINRPSELDDQAAADMGIKFWLGHESIHSDRTKAEHELTKKRGCLFLSYSEPWGMRQRIGNSRQRILPTVDERMEILQSWAKPTPENQKTKWFNGFSRVLSAQVCLNTLVLKPDGEYDFTTDDYDGVLNWWKTNADPRLREPNRLRTCWGGGKDPDNNHGYDPALCDGIYIDCVDEKHCNKSANIRPRHLAVMTENLIYDPITAKPCASTMQHLMAFMNHMATKVHANGGYVSGNVFNLGHRFTAAIMDFCNAEVGAWGNGDDGAHLVHTFGDKLACVKRFHAYRRPVAGMLQEGHWMRMNRQISAAGITNYVNEAMFYGFYPGMSTIGGEKEISYARWPRYFGAKEKLYNRDRQLFKDSVPVVRRLNAAGWEPETCMRADNAAMMIERFGDPSRGEMLFTVRNDSKATLTTVLRPDAIASMGFKRLVPIYGEAVASTKDVKGGGFTVTIKSYDTIVYRAEL